MAAEFFASFRGARALDIALITAIISVALAGARAGQIWRHSALWALLVGFCAQFILGLFASIVAIIVLVPAERCPLALPKLPFWLYLLGVTLALLVYEEGAIFGVFHAPGRVHVWDPFLGRRLPSVLSLFA
jgi:hypothetical protein